MPVLSYLHQLFSAEQCQAYMGFFAQPPKKVYFGD